MQSLNISHQSPSKIASGRLPRINTTNSFNSDHSHSPVPLSQHRIPSTPSTHSIQNVEPPDLSPSEARAEILLRLNSKVDSSQRKSTTTPSMKHGFSIRRTNTVTKFNDHPSQDVLTDVLEEVALEGNLSLVKAVIALGADPVYRSTARFRKMKHEALSKATSKGWARVVDFLLQRGASYGDVHKKISHTPIDRALLGAVYQGYVDLVICLICSHGANPMAEQWPREMYDAQHYWAESQVRLAKTSVIDGISKWKNVEEGMRVLKTILEKSNFDPVTPVSGVFDTKSELQAQEFGYRPWHTTYQYSALSCFVRAGWTDAVELMLSIKGSMQDYTKDDEVLQYQDKVTRYISPVSALTKETWEQRPDEALRILRFLIERDFDIGLVQRTATDLGPRSALGRALSADAAQGVELILQRLPSLAREEVMFRRLKKDTRALPLAAALSLGRLETARVLLRTGAHPRDLAFDNMNVLQFAAYEGDATSVAIFETMIKMAPELTYDVLEVAIHRLNWQIVRIILDHISGAALREQVVALPPLYDMLLRCPEINKNGETAQRYCELIDMIIQWDAGQALPRPQLSAILSAIRKDNYIGMERLLRFGTVDGSSLVLNSKAQPYGEQGLWTMLECCELTDRSTEWLRLLRHYGAPLYQ